MKLSAPSSLNGFLKRKNIEFSFSRYALKAMSAMAQGLFCTLLIGTILKTIGTEAGIDFLMSAGSLAQSMAGPAMATAIGYALQSPPMVLFTLVPVGFYTNQLAGAGGPFAVYVVAILASEVGKAVSGETKVDLLVTPLPPSARVWDLQALQAALLWRAVALKWWGLQL